MQSSLNLNNKRNSSFLISSKKYSSVEAEETIEFLKLYVRFWLLSLP